MKLLLNQFDSVFFDCNSEKMSTCTNKDYVRYLKGVYTNKERLIARFIEPKLKLIENLKNTHKDFYNKILLFFNYITSTYDSVSAFSFEESFKIKDREFQALVFSSINITEMIDSLGAKRIKTDGINVKHRKYDEDGNFTGIEDYHNVYEMYEVDGNKLGVKEFLYVVKCWCTSTNKEHWLWVSDEHKNDPLSAIASTFMVHKNIIPNITALKRQGDILLVETDKEVFPEGEMVSLTKEQYFGLLVAQA